jgi:hypothetical protein
MIEKISLIKDNRDAAIAALNAYLDKIYSLIEDYFENGKLKEGLTPDAKLEKFILELRDDTIKFESVRRKLIDNDFNLSTVEINYIALSFVYITECWQSQIKNLTIAVQQSQEITKTLMAKSIT